MSANQRPQIDTAANPIIRSRQAGYVDALCKKPATPPQESPLWAVAYMQGYSEGQRRAPKHGSVRAEREGR